MSEILLCEALHPGWPVDFSYPINNSIFLRFLSRWYISVLVGSPLKTLVCQFAFYLVKLIVMHDQRKLVA